MSKKIFSNLFTLWLSSLFHKEPQNRDELITLIHDSAINDLIDPETSSMLKGVMDIAEQRVRDIMIPRSQMITLNVEQSFDECLSIVSEHSHSRYPIINEDKDHIEGILHAKDFLIYLFNNKEHAVSDFDIRNMMRPSIIVPESKRVDSMLKDFRSKRYHMAIVVDEFGGVSGLVTIEDILELIVGDIVDEFDEEEDRNIRKLNHMAYSVRALTPIDEFNDTFTSQFSEEDNDTIGGMVLDAFGHLPKRGESVVIQGYQFKVTLVDSRRIIQLQVHLPDEAQRPIL